MLPSEHKKWMPCPGTITVEVHTICERHPVWVTFLLESVRPTMSKRRFYRLRGRVWAAYRSGELTFRWGHK